MHSLSRSRIIYRNFSRCCQVLQQQAKPKEAKCNAKGDGKIFNEHFNVIEEFVQNLNNLLIYFYFNSITMIANMFFLEKIHYKRLDIQDRQLGQLMLLVKSKRKLENEEQIIVEGKQLILEAVEAHLKLNHLLFSHLEKIEEVCAVMGDSTGHVNFLRVPQQDLSQWSVLTTCPGLIGIFDKPHVTKIKKNAYPITVICDNIREPNNVGAVVRIANALPASKVLMPKGCANPWDVKAIRGSSGSIFHMPTEDSLTWEMIDDSANSDDNTVVLIADSNNENYIPSRCISYDEIPKELIAGKEIFLVIGGETHGVSDEARAFAARRNWKVINISTDPTVESLNTSNALAIVLFELRRNLSKIT